MTLSPLPAKCANSLFSNSTVDIIFESEEWNFHALPEMAPFSKCVENSIRRRHVET